MINVKMICRCDSCNDLAKINTVYVEEKNEETYLVKEYICDCGNIMQSKEVINYTL